MSLKEMQPDDLFFKFYIDTTTDFVRWSSHLKNEINLMMAQMPCKIPYCQGTASFAFQVKWYKYDTSDDVILSAPPSFISALIVKNSILNNFTHSAMNSDEQWSGAQSKFHYFNLFKEKIIDQLLPERIFCNQPRYIFYSSSLG